MFYIRRFIKFSGPVGQFQIRFLMQVAQVEDEIKKAWGKPEQDAYLPGRLSSPQHTLSAEKDWNTVFPVGLSKSWVKRYQ